MKCLFLLVTTVMGVLAGVVVASDDDRFYVNTEFRLHQNKYVRIGVKAWLSDDRDNTIRYFYDTFDRIVAEIDGRYWCLTEKIYDFLSFDTCKLEAKQGWVINKFGNWANKQSGLAIMLSSDILIKGKANDRGNLPATYTANLPRPTPFNQEVMLFKSGFEWTEQNMVSRGQYLVGQPVYYDLVTKLLYTDRNHCFVGSGLNVLLQPCVYNDTKNANFKWEVQPVHVSTEILIKNLASNNFFAIERNPNHNFKAIMTFSAKSVNLNKKAAYFVYDKEAKKLMADFNHCLTRENHQHQYCDQRLNITLSGHILAPWDQLVCLIKTNTPEQHDWVPCSSDEYGDKLKFQLSDEDKFYYTRVNNTLEPIRLWADSSCLGDNVYYDAKGRRLVLFDPKEKAMVTYTGIATPTVVSSVVIGEGQHAEMALFIVSNNNTIFKCYHGAPSVIRIKTDHQVAVGMAVEHANYILTNMPEICRPDQHRARIRRTLPDDHTFTPELLALLREYGRARPRTDYVNMGTCLLQSVAMLRAIYSGPDRLLFPHDIDDIETYMNRHYSHMQMSYLNEARDDAYMHRHAEYYVHNAVGIGHMLGLVPTYPIMGNADDLYLHSLRNPGQMIMVFTSGLPGREANGHAFLVHTTVTPSRVCYNTGVFLTNLVSTDDHWYEAQRGHINGTILHNMILYDMHQNPDNIVFWTYQTPDGIPVEPGTLNQGLVLAVAQEPLGFCDIMEDEELEHGGNFYDLFVNPYNPPMPSPPPSPINFNSLMGGLSPTSCVFP
ncbi:protein ORF115 [Lake sturgeon herpesvirus]|nr:protein ORF115 [Lake sturgeon herpesvirus]